MLNLGTGHFSSPVCLLCVEGGGGEGDRFFFSGGMAWFSRETQGDQSSTTKFEEGTIEN